MKKHYQVVYWVDGKVQYTEPADYETTRGLKLELIDCGYTGFIQRVFDGTVPEQ